ncbi:MAG: Panacea domain-containing protein [Armatimonadota bacterium]|nr:Panacea domain-containing protein [Armatimonadota bacterium]
MSGVVIDDPLEVAICRILAVDGAAGVTRLMKLLYLAELEHVHRSGRPLTGAVFINYDYGPFCRSAYEAMERLAARGVVREVRHITRGGHLCRLQHAVADKMQLVDPTSHARDVIDQTVRRWRDASLDEVVGEAKASAPFRESSYGEELDLGAGAPPPFSRPSDIDRDALLPDFI